MLDFTKLWDKTYLLGPNPEMLSRSDHIFFWAALLFLLAGGVAKIFVARQNPGSPHRFLYSRFFHLFLTTGPLVLLWVGLRFENIPWLSAHIVVLVLFLVWFIWLGFILKYYFRQFRSQSQAWEEERTRQKYLK